VTANPEPASTHYVHHLLWECFARLVPIADEVFADAQVTLPLAGMLDMIGSWPGATVAEISRKGPKTQQAVSQLVARLERLGLVERRAGSGRGVGLYLTPAGDIARSDGLLREERLEARFRELLGEQTYAKLGAALDSASIGLSDQASRSN
jgi:DNA-binding MarR family transcriptional regulator